MTHTTGPLHFTDIKAQPVPRISSTVAELDWLYGEDKGVYGLPEGALSLWGGAAGVGKTRAVVSVASGMLHLDERTVLFFPLEMTPEMFVSKHCHGKILPGAQLWVHGAKALDEQVKAILEIRPHLIVVDSANKINEFNNGRGANEIEEAYRKAAGQVGAHVFFVSQLNREGSVKGGTDLPHMVDIVLHIIPYGDPKYRNFEPERFTVRIPDKNRFGKSGREIHCRHHDFGVFFDSKMRLDDPEWLEYHNYDEQDARRLKAGLEPRESGFMKFIDKVRWRG